MQNKKEQLLKNYNRNKWLNVGDGTFFTVSYAFIMPGVTIVAFLKHYTDNKIILNLPILFTYVFMALGTFLASFISGKFIKKKKATIISSIAFRVSWILVIFSIIFFKSNSNRFIIIFFIAYAIVHFLTLYCFKNILWVKHTFRAVALIFWQTPMVLSYHISNGCLHSCS